MRPMRPPPPLLLLVFLSASLHAARDPHCPIQPTTTIAIYADTNGGAGHNSVAWTARFFTWWASVNPPNALEYALIDTAASIADPVTGCDLLAFPLLRLWVQPGGSSDNQTLALGPGGRDNILNFPAKNGKRVYATYLFIH